jgi:hypothetical protein
MKRKVSLIAISILVLALIVSGCAQDANPADELKAKDNAIAALEKEKKVLEDKISELEGKIAELEEAKNAPDSQNSMISTALDVVHLLNDKDMTGISTYVHPTKGVRFSPYGNVDVSSDQVFTAEQLEGLMTDAQVYTWGSYDGSGEPINLNFTDYFEEFVYDEDYENPHMIGNNVVIGHGNSLINIDSTYPDGVFAEFHFTGFDPQYEGIDWSSLRLVFEEQDGTWYLVGIIHDQWTI